VFGIHPGDGTLKPLQRVPSGGTTPRHFAIDPTGQWLLAANQGSDTINLLRIDPTSGRLTPTDRSLGVISPVCIEFVSSGSSGEPGAEE
jgi:6-phosphogluconolactonase